MEKYYVCEMKALVFAEYLFRPWLSSLNFDEGDVKCYVQYGLYLCDSDKEFARDLGVQLSPIHKEVWLKQLQRKLQKIELTIEKFQEFLSSTYCKFKEIEKLQCV